MEEKKSDLEEQSTNIASIEEMSLDEATDSVI